MCKGYGKRIITSANSSTICTYQLIAISIAGRRTKRKKSSGIICILKSTKSKIVYFFLFNYTKSRAETSTQNHHREKRSFEEKSKEMIARIRRLECDLSSEESHREQTRYIIFNFSQMFSII